MKITYKHSVSGNGGGSATIVQSDLQAKARKFAWQAVSIRLTRARGNAVMATLVTLGAVSIAAGSVYGIVSQRSVAQGNAASGHVLARAAVILSTESGTAADGYPLPPAGSIAHSDGYQIPASSGAPRVDASNAAILYCPFDNGTSNTSTGRLTGDTPGADSTVVFALVSAGPNRTLQTSCVNAKAGIAGGDDILKRMTVADVRASGSMKYYLAPVDCENAATPTSDLAGNPSNCAVSRSRLDLLPTSALVDGAMVTIRKSGKAFQWVASVSQWREAAGSGGGYTAPDDFNFTPVTGANTNTLTVSNTVNLTNVSAGAPISIDGIGEYQVNGGLWTKALGSVQPGDTVAVRLTSSSSPMTTISTIVNVAGKTKLFSVTTGNVVVEDVFNTSVYVGNATSRTFNTGTDLQGAGGLTWFKDRGNPANHILVSKATGISNFLSTNNNSGLSSVSGLTYTSSGFSLDAASYLNSNGASFVATTFREAPQFFDVVTWTGDGAGDREIPHSLGAMPGMILVKATNSAGDWFVWHRSLAGTEYLKLNTTDAKMATGAPGIIQPNSGSFWVHQYGAPWVHNQAGVQYTAFLFGHDASANGLIQCGSFTTDGSGNATVTLGWEPQALISKTSSTAGGNWFMVDSMRGWTVAPAHQTLYANLSNAEASVARFAPTATGFTFAGGAGEAGTTYVYMVIRRGPMRPPASGSQVFNAQTWSFNAVGTPAYNTLSLPNADLVFGSPRTAGTIYGREFVDRLRGSNQKLLSTTNSAEGTGSYPQFDTNGFRFDLSNGGDYVAHLFRRYPGVFDVVAYSGDNFNARQVPHSLGTVPELIILKSRNSPQNWVVNSGTTLANSVSLVMNSNAGAGASGGVATRFSAATSFYVDALPTSNATGTNYVAYLFGSLAGVSKIGTYSGSASDVTVDTGFAGAPRYVLIKRTDSTGNWIVFDGVRGIVNGGGDPAIFLNSTVAEAPGNYIEPTASGFIARAGINDVNANGGSYIFLAIR